MNMKEQLTNSVSSNINKTPMIFIPEVMRPIEALNLWRTEIDKKIADGTITAGAK